MRCPGVSGCRWYHAGMTPEERDIVLMRIQDDVDYLVEEIKKLRAEVRKAVAILLKNSP